MNQKFRVILGSMASFGLAWDTRGPDPKVKTHMQGSEAVLILMHLELCTGRDFLQHCAVRTHLGATSSLLGQVPPPLCSTSSVLPPPSPGCPLPTALLAHFPYCLSLLSFKSPSFWQVC